MPAGGRPFKVKLIDKFLLPVRNLRAALLGSGWRSISKCDVLLICHDVDRYEVIQNLKYSPILDSFADRYLAVNGLSCSRIATPFSLMVGGSAWGHPHHFNLCAWLASLPKSPFRKFFTHSSLFGKIIDCARCKAVIAIDTTPELCKACHEHDVLCIEIAHGMGYTSFDARFGGRERGELPDGFICYDDVSAKAWQELTGDLQSPWLIGHPWFTRFLEGGDRAGMSLPNHLLKKIGQFKKVVLLSLQWGYDDEDERTAGILTNGVLAEEIQQAIERTQTDVLWLVRLHPVQMEGSRYARHRDFLRILDEKSVNVFSECSSLPLPLLLSVCHGHVTMSSMVCYEASWIGIPSIAMCPTIRPGGIFHDLFDDLSSAGFVLKTALNCERLMDWLTSLESKKRDPFCQFDQNGTDLEIECLCNTIRNR
jgi:hypothetical protein